MLELSLLGTIALLLGLALWFQADSDDDDSNGGLLQPVLIPVRHSSEGRR
jgi:hypothetical protein